MLDFWFVCLGRRWLRLPLACGGLTCRFVQLVWGIVLRVTRKEVSTKCVVELDRSWRKETGVDTSLCKLFANHLVRYDLNFIWRNYKGKVLGQVASSIRNTFVDECFFNKYLQTLFLNGFTERDHICQSPGQLRQFHFSLIHKEYASGSIIIVSVCVVCMVVMHLLLMLFAFFK